MNLDKLQAAMKAAEKQLKKDADAGEFAKQAVSFEPTGFSLQPVFDYYAHVKKEAREVLEARYRTEIGDEPPANARHDWLATRCGYAFQIRAYEAAGITVPPVVFWRAEEWKRMYPGTACGRAHDMDDPADVEFWDDSFVSAATANPYQRGDARKAFFAVEMSGADGIAFEPLCKTLEEMLETTVASAQEKALWFFTKGVREGLTKVVVR